eukprot:1368057-Rhodomonas_salina.2
MHSGCPPRRCGVQSRLSLSHLAGSTDWSRFMVLISGADAMRAVLMSAGSGGGAKENAREGGTCTTVREQPEARSSSSWGSCPPPAYLPGRTRIPYPVTVERCWLTCAWQAAEESDPEGHRNQTQGSNRHALPPSELRPQSTLPGNHSELLEWWLRLPHTTHRVLAANHHAVETDGRQPHPSRQAVWYIFWDAVWACNNRMRQIADNDDVPVPRAAPILVPALLPRCFSLPRSPPSSRFLDCSG